MDRFHKSFSMGVAQKTHEEQELKDLIKLADEALYKAKDSGRSQIVFSEHCGAVL